HRSSQLAVVSAKAHALILISMTNQTVKNLAFGIGGTLPVLALTTWGWGNWTTFFSNPARVGLIILTLAGAIAYAFSGSSCLGIGRREDPSSRWIFISLIIIAIVFAWLSLLLAFFNLCVMVGVIFCYFCCV